MSTTALLAVLDAERRAVVREWSPDRTECRIVYADVSASQLNDAIREQQSLARAGGYRLEWKVYGHDVAALAESLRAAGFEAGDVEAVLGLELQAVDWQRFERTTCETRRVRDDSGLADVASISTQIGRRDAEAERSRLATVLRERDDQMSVHVAYIAGEPVSSGRIHFGRTPGVAELAGGRTVTTHRKRGLFTAIVAARLREAAARGCRYIFVDALPTSEPILTKLGFVTLTSTQPFTYDGRV